MLKRKLLRRLSVSLKLKSKRPNSEACHTRLLTNVVRQLIILDVLHCSVSLLCTTKNIIIQLSLKSHHIVIALFHYANVMYICNVRLHVVSYRFDIDIITYAIAPCLKYRPLAVSCYH